MTLAASPDNRTSLPKLLKGILGITVTFTMMFSTLAVVSMMFIDPSDSNSEDPSAGGSTTAIGWQDNTDAVLAAFPGIRSHPDFQDWERVADVLRNFPNDQESIPGKDSKEEHYTKGGPPRNFDRVRAAAASMTSLSEKYQYPNSVEFMLKRIDLWGSKPRVNIGSMWRSLEECWRRGFEHLLFRVTATLQGPQGVRGMTVGSVNSALSDVGLPVLKHGRRTGSPEEPVMAEEWISELRGAPLSKGIKQATVRVLTSGDGLVLRLSIGVTASEQPDAILGRLTAQGAERSRLDTSMIVGLSVESSEVFRRFWTHLDEEIAGQVANVFSSLGGMSSEAFGSDMLNDETHSCRFLNDHQTSGGVLNGSGNADFGILSFSYVAREFDDVSTNIATLRDGFSTE